MKFGPAPFLSSHIEGEVAWVNLLYVPPSRRRHGLGRHMFEDWLHRLPPDVHSIKLVVAAVDGEATDGFWAKMGFGFEPIDTATVDVSGSYMVRALDVGQAGAAGSLRTGEV